MAAITYYNYIYLVGQLESFGEGAIPGNYVAVLMMEDRDMNVYNITVEFSDVNDDWATEISGMIYQMVGIKGELREVFDEEHQVRRAYMAGKSISKFAD